MLIDKYINIYICNK